MQKPENLVHCPKYSDLRKTFFQQYLNVNLSDEENVINLLNNITCKQHLKIFIGTLWQH